MNRFVSLLRLASLMLCAALLTSSANAVTTWYVATTGKDTNSGTTQAAPFLTIHHAVLYASANDTISVADGTYTGAGNHNIDFGGVDLTVKSTSSNPIACIIDCQQQDRAFYLHNSETNKSVISGFTIKNGETMQNGGGIYVASNDPKISNCVFIGCTAVGNGFGGGGGGGVSGGTVSDCTFTGNISDDSGGGMYGGAAINCFFTNNSAYGYSNGGGMAGGTATNCTFINNSADNGSGMYSGTANSCVFTSNTATSGGGMYGGTATNCIFAINTARVGGGMENGTAVDCTFANNTSSVAGGGMSGGAATNCVFFGNTATQNTSGGVTTPANGGGTADTNLYFCTIVNNSAQGNGGGVYSDNGYTVTNCIIWGNTAVTSGLNVYGSGNVTYSNIQRGFTGTGNINSDPLFVNQATGNLHLKVGSPCINTATTYSNMPTTDLDGGKRTIGTKPDMGAYEYGNVGVYGTLAFDGISTLAPAQIVTFRFRPTTGADINMTYFTTADGAFYLYGVPNGSYMMRVKSPTYLAASVPVTVAGGIANITATLEPGDANNDNSVDSTDFGVLIGAFNTMASVPGSGYDPTADFNGDGVVDSSDFGLLIGNFNTVGAP